MSATGGPSFVGRASERDALDGLLARVREGGSEVLVIRGEAGIGKTALLRYAARQASGYRVAELAGVEAEMELPFAGVHQLCAAMLDRLDALPAPQRTALRVALGLTAGDVPDRFLVGLAVLGLLAAVAEERPLLCLVEDAQWLDGASSQILGLVARRVHAESLAILIAVREPAAERHDFEGLPELRLGGLLERDAHVLLAGAVAGRLDGQVADRLVAETGGNPLALLELPARMTPAELAGGFELPGAGELPAHIEAHYVRRVRQLPEATQRLMLLAAAEPLGDAALVLRAGRTLDIDPDAFAPAEAAELLDIGMSVRFRHPLVRSAVYRSAPIGSRQRAHEALASVSDPDSDADRRAWHRALAAPGPDEEVAAELEQSAGRAQGRGGVAAAAAFLQRAVALTPDPARRRRTAARGGLPDRQRRPHAPRAGRVSPAVSGRRPLLVEGTSPRQLARLEAGDLHLAVVSADARPSLQAPRAGLIHLLDDPMLVALPQAHRLAKRRSLRLSGLAAESWIPGGETVQDPLRTLAPDLVERGRIKFVAREWTAKQGLVAAGFGATLVPALAVSTVRRGVALVALHGDDAPARVGYAVTAGGVTRPPVADAFIAVVRDVVVELAATSASVAYGCRGAPVARDRRTSTGSRPRRLGERLQSLCCRSTGRPPLGPGAIARTCRRSPGSPAARPSSVILTIARAGRTRLRGLGPIPGTAAAGGP